MELSLRTHTHSCPQEELDEMNKFYGEIDENGKLEPKCVVSNVSRNVQWFHMLDAALTPSNKRLSLMLSRKLRVDRHPRLHAAEVRENIVPLNVDHHSSMDVCPTQSTLFLHEDILTRTLLYERQLKKWRVEEMRAGRGDPGRPPYQTVFHGMEITLHRYHVAGDFQPFIRLVDNGIPHVYYSSQCPGVDPAGPDNFPILRTLLSIPFSLLHTLPRLTGLLPISAYQQQLIAIGSEIIRLWWWEPSLELKNEAEKIALSRKQPSSPQPQPQPVHRISTTFKQLLVTRTNTTSTEQSSKRTLQQDAHAVELPSGQILFGTVPLVLLDRDGLLMTTADEGSAELASEAWDIETAEVAEDDDTDAESEIYSPSYDVDGESSGSFDIISWCEKMDCGPEPLHPLIPSPFERGTISGLSVNDILMIKGLMHPLVYVHFLDLSSFSLS